MNAFCKAADTSSACREVVHCSSKRLIIELDGGHHTKKLIGERDAKREQYLKDEAYLVLRFWNNEVDANLEGVLESIREAVLK